MSDRGKPMATRSGGKKSAFVKWIMEAETISPEETERFYKEKGYAVKPGYGFGPGYLAYFRPENVSKEGEDTIYLFEKPAPSDLKLLTKQKELQPGVFVEYYRHVGDYWHFGRVIVKPGGEAMALSRADIDRYKPQLSPEKMSKEWTDYKIFKGKSP